MISYIATYVKDIHIQHYKIIVFIVFLLSSVGNHNYLATLLYIYILLSGSSAALYYRLIYDEARQLPFMLDFAAPPPPPPPHTHTHTYDAWLVILLSFYHMKDFPLEFSNRGGEPLVKWFHSLLPVGFTSKFLEAGFRFLQFDPCLI